MNYLENIYMYYLVQVQFSWGIGLLAPDEIEDISIQSRGNFYLESNTNFNDNLKIHAINNNKIEEYRMIKIKNKLIVNVTKLGQFVFRNKVNVFNYHGNKYPHLKFKILKQFYIENYELAEKVCQKNNFYFIGYTDFYSKKAKENLR